MNVSIGTKFEEELVKMAGSFLLSAFTTSKMVQNYFFEEVFA